MSQEPIKVKIKRVVSIYFENELTVSGNLKVIVCVDQGTFIF